MRVVVECSRFQILFAVNRPEPDDDEAMVLGGDFDVAEQTDDDVDLRFGFRAGRRRRRDA
jgi:hypothetical protein